MTDLEMFEMLDDMLDKWIMDYRPDVEDCRNADRVLNELRSRIHRDALEKKN